MEKQKVLKIIFIHAIHAIHAILTIHTIQCYPMLCLSNIIKSGKNDKENEHGKDLKDQSTIASGDGIQFGDFHGTLIDVTPHGLYIVLDFGQGLALGLYQRGHFAKERGELGEGSFGRSCLFETGSRRSHTSSRLDLCLECCCGCG